MTLYSGRLCTPAPTLYAKPRNVPARAKVLHPEGVIVAHVQINRECRRSRRARHSQIFTRLAVSLCADSPVRKRINLQKGPCHRRIDGMWKLPPS
jgi:hypothetical protein